MIRVGEHSRRRESKHLKISASEDVKQLVSYLKLNERHVKNWAFRHSCSHSAGEFTVKVYRMFLRSSRTPVLVREKQTLKIQEKTEQYQHSFFKCQATEYRAEMVFYGSVGLLLVAGCCSTRWAAFRDNCDRANCARKCQRRDRLLDGVRDPNPAAPGRSDRSCWSRSCSYPLGCSFKVQLSAVSLKLASLILPIAEGSAHESTGSLALQFAQEQAASVDRFAHNPRVQPVTRLHSSITIWNKRHHNR